MTDAADTHDFDKRYWERHWTESRDPESSTHAGHAPHPYLARETAGLTPGTALDAGSGAGEEAIWLAAQGWRVTAADISAAGLARASARAKNESVSDRVTWVQADLTTWEPPHPFDLVTTSYAHPAMPQLAFYHRIAGWVAPGGALLIVGHRHDAAPAGHTPPPAEAEVTLADIVGGLDPARWHIETAEEYNRIPPQAGDGAHALHDVIVRATRLP